jgi:hypothetical protein
MCTHNQLLFWSIPFVIATITLSSIVVIWHWWWRLLSCWSCRHCCRHSRWQRDDYKDYWNSSGRNRLANRRQFIKFVDDVLSGVKISRRLCMAEYLRLLCGFSRWRSSGEGISRLLRNSGKIIFPTHKNPSWTGRTRFISDILPLALRFTKFSPSFMSYNLYEIL